MLSPHEEEMYKDIIEECRIRELKIQKDAERLKIATTQLVSTLDALHTGLATLYTTSMLAKEAAENCRDAVYRAYLSGTPKQEYDA